MSLMFINVKTDIFAAINRKNAVAQGQISATTCFLMSDSQVYLDMQKHWRLGRYGSDV